MAIEFVKCRRRDDHSVTHDIARQALQMWPDWEPIPDDEGEQAAQPADSPAAKPADPAQPTTSKSRSKAATDPKE